MSNSLVAERVIEVSCWRCSRPVRVATGRYFVGRTQPCCLRCDPRRQSSVIALPENGDKQ